MIGPRVVSASRRTDLPAFGADWLLERIQAGWCDVANPFNGRISRVSLLPADVWAFVFWTRHAGPLLRRLDALRDYAYYFHYTINGYPRALESRNPPLDVAVATLRELSGAIGAERVLWRYDPIILSEALTPPAYHLDRFAEIAARLAGATSRCYVSFVDSYGKTARGLAAVGRATGATFREPSPAERQEIIGRLVEIGAQHDIALYACAEPDLLALGVRRARCVDPEVIAALRGDGAGSRLRAAPTRPACGCVESVDIGKYDTCAFGCAYCYATRPRAAALGRIGHSHSSLPPD